MEITKSCGNVFLDLGFRSTMAENLRIRADLMIELRDVIILRTRNEVPPEIRNLLQKIK